MTSRAAVAFCAIALTTQVDAFAINKRSARPQTRLFDVEDATSCLGIDEDFVPFPSSDYKATEIVDLCMEALSHNSEPYSNAGLEVCWNFSSDRCRAALGGSFDDFVDFASNPVFASMVNAKDWSIKSTGNEIPGTQTRGAMQTVLITVVPHNGSRQREFLWTVYRERRPPRQNCWLVHECIAKEAAYQHTL